MNRITLIRTAVYISRALFAATALHASAALAQEGQVVKGLDGEAWVLANRQVMSGVTMMEYVRQGQNIETSKELYTIMKMPGTTDAGAMAQKVMSMTQANCASFNGLVYWGESSDTLYEWNANGCNDPKYKAEHEIARLIRMDDGVYRLSYAWHEAQMPATNRSQWLKLISEAWRKGPVPLETAVTQAVRYGNTQPQSADATATAASGAESVRQQKLKEADARAKVLAEQLAKEFDEIYPDDDTKPTASSAPAASSQVPAVPASSSGSRTATLHKMLGNGTAGAQVSGYAPLDNHYAVVLLSRADVGKTIRGVWYGPASVGKNPFAEKSFPVESSNDRAVFYVVGSSAFPEGDYRFEAYLDGALVSTIPYRVAK